MDLSPEGVEPVLHFQEGREEVAAIEEDRGYEGGSETMTEVRRKAFAGGGEAFDGTEGALCEGEATSKVGVGGQGRGKPVSQPSNFILGRKVEVVEPDACGGGRGALLGRAPVNKFSFGDGEGQSFGGCDAAEGAVMALQELDVPPV